MSRHHDIVKIIRARCQNDQDWWNANLDIPDSILIRAWFSNLRSSKANQFEGLRLTLLGYHALSPYFAHWHIPLEKGYIVKPSHLLFFDRTCTEPWYLNKAFLVLFEPQLAMRAKLVGNMDHLVTAFEPITS